MFDVAIERGVRGAHGDDPAVGLEREPLALDAGSDADVVVVQGAVGVIVGDHGADRAVGPCDAAADHDDAAVGREGDPFRLIARMPEDPRVN